MEVMLDGEGGRRLVLRDVRGDLDGLRFTATLSIPHGEASVTLWDYKTGLHEFIRELAYSWRGFEGVREYSTVEGELSLSCQHDGLGTVTCNVTLRQPWPPEWSMEARLDFGAGAHLERLAGDVGAFFERDR